jgi:hypothetical protein
MTSTNSRLARTCAVLAVATAALLIDPTPTSLFADAKAKSAEIKKYDKDGDGGKGVAALAELESDLSPEANKELLYFAEKAKTSQIAVKAIELLAARKDEGFEKKLKGLIDDKKDYGKDDPDRYIAILAAAGAYENPKLGDALLDAAKKYFSATPAISDAAVHSFGTVKDKKNVEELIALLPPLESRATNLSQETKDNNAKSKAAVIDTLAKLTGLEWADWKQWSDYWKENQKKFEFPKAEEAEQAVDFPNLREHTDRTYGIHVKLPELAFKDKNDETVEFFAFKFERGPADVRFQVNVYDDTGNQAGRVEYFIYNTKQGEINTPDKMVDFLAGQAKKVWITEFSREPTTEAKKFGGLDWASGLCAGQSGAGFAGWGTVERRYYSTKLGPVLLYINSLIRAGAATEPVGKALVEMIESTTIEKE